MIIFHTGEVTERVMVSFNPEFCAFKINSVMFYILDNGKAFFLGSVSDVAMVA